MSVLELTGAIWIGALVAGFLGSLTGLGGGVVIVPLLTLGFGADIRYAIGASLISVIATSSGAAIAYVREGFTNIRVGMLLEIATTLGASLGALLATVVAPRVIAVVFGLVLLCSVYRSGRSGPQAGISLRTRWRRGCGCMAPTRGPKACAATRSGGCRWDSA